MRRGPLRCVALIGAVMFCAACGSSGPTPAPVTTSTTSTTVTTSTTSTTTTAAAPTTTTFASNPIDTTPHTRLPIAVPLPAFSGSVTTVTAADLSRSYRAGCPVGPAQLRALHMSYWGFDDRPHTGTMIVNATVTDPVLAVFRRLYDARFPIRRMQPVDAYGGSDPASMAADNTSAFNCRNAVAPGPPHWSAHAYGEAVDVNTVENPYVEGRAVQPAAGSAFVDRANRRPGMAYDGGELVSAFAAVGWQWGGRWSAPDYQHFSSTGG